uniref:Glycosyltransferase 2-like domain-containing protein n=1 Tax=Strigamia maritima TaxID=126957 RepID=T1IRQ0_STRMM
MDISIILPVYNAEKWLDECLTSVYHQEFDGNYEISIFNDASTDNSMHILKNWKNKFESIGIDVILTNSQLKSAKGVGYARNRAIEKSKGEFLCFLDADDTVRIDRLQKQFVAGQSDRNAIIGSRFSRDPEGSTARYSRWANNIKDAELYTQIYTSHGPTVLMPTWFCHRDVYKNVGGFNEDGKGVPEDLIFFYQHLEQRGRLHKVDEDLLMYRYHSDATSFSVLEESIWRLRLTKLESDVLKYWDSFTIWSAGKQGRRFYRSLTSENRKKVRAFCDVDGKKIFKAKYTFEESLETPKPTVPIIHYTTAIPPLIICVKLDLTNGSFEANLRSLNLKEGVDYFHFG